MLINGSDLMAFMAAPSDAATPADGVKNARSIGCATSHTLTINHSTREISHKDKGSGRFKYTDFGQIDWSVSAEGFICDKQPFIDGDTNKSNTADNVRKGHGMGDIFDALMNRQPVYVCFAIEADSEDYRNGKLAEPKEGGWSLGASPTGYYGGYAWITNITETAPVAEYATYSIEFEGNGELTRVKPEDIKDYSLTPSAPVVTVSAAKKTTAETK